MFLKEDTELPMMFMDDAIKATVDIMQAPETAIKIRSSYNLSAISFTPKAIANSIKTHLPDFKISYKPDYRQEIANSWPKNINDSYARQDWKWKHKFNLDEITEEMLKQLNKSYNS